MVRAYSVFLGLLGAILLAGGGYLAVLHGSPYYCVSGVALLVAAVQLWRHRRAGACVYAAYLVVTIAWAIWESGFDGWALMPRIVAPVVVGLWLLLPAVRRRLAGQGVRGGFALLPGSIAAACVVGGVLHHMRDLPADPLYQQGIVDGPVAAFGRAAAVTQDWPNYGGDPGGSRFSGLDQVTPANVAQLVPAWTYHIGGIHLLHKNNLQTTPLKVGDMLYACTADNVVVAIDAETGRQVWRTDPRTDTSGLSPAMTCRGVSYTRVPGASGLCAGRIYTNTVDARLIALDAQTGRRCPGFGQDGEVSLLAGMGQVTKGYYYVSSPPAVVRGRIVLGGWISDSQYWGEPSGVIRAFDAVTGRLSWAFDMGRPDRATLPPPGESFTRSTPNSWAPMSADEALGLVYVPTGNATPDYYGGRRRPFDDKYSSSVVAIDAETGHVRWSFQAIHHDLWDYDVPSQPTLADLPGARGPQHILIQATKTGELFMLDRETGKPLATVNEHPVPHEGALAPGERISPTQPFSDGMPSNRGPLLSEEMMWGVTPLDQMWCRIAFRQSWFDGQYTPPGLGRYTIVSPGYAGGSNWGSVTIDRDRGILITNSLRMANRVQLISRQEADARHLAALTRETGHFGVGGGVPQLNTPVGALVSPFLSPLSMPCQQPPYGMISAIDLRSRKLIWTRRLGTARDSGPLGIGSGLPIPMGVPSFGGSIATRSGLTFIGASQDRYLRAFGTETGKLLWQARLPAGGQATPMTYLGRSGRQFVAIAAGGNNAVGTKMGDYIVAYALPRQ
jgi:quinoprotein glucose dehydrogenase